MHTIGAKSHLWDRGPEAILALGLMAHGRKIALYDTLSSNGTTRTYAVLAEVVNGVSWGAFGIAIGVLWLVALVLNGTFPRFRRISPWARSAAALLTMVYWLIFAFGMQMGNVSSVGLEAHGTLAALAAFMAFRVAREVGAMEGEMQRCRQRQFRN